MGWLTREGTFQTLLPALHSRPVYRVPCTVATHSYCMHTLVMSYSRCCSWRVQTSYGTENSLGTSPWSEYFYFTTGLWSLASWRGAQWIQGGPYLSTTVTLPSVNCESSAVNVTRVSAFVSGLGWYQLFVNGGKVGDRELDVGWTRYNRRVLYSTYDLTAEMCSAVGEGNDGGSGGYNAGLTATIAVALGGGHFADNWYNGSVFQGRLLLLLVSVDSV